MIAKLKLSLLLSSIAWLGACGETVELENEGGLCVMGTDLEWVEDGEDETLVTTFEEDTAVEIQVTLEECASACIEDVEASCEVDLDGDTLTVTARGSYVAPSGGGNCVDACEVVRATCTTDPLAAGTYTVEYVGESVSFDVPSVIQPLSINGAYCEL
jgi:hypothetical protein